jgi:hypothetical protein
MMCLGCRQGQTSLEMAFWDGLPAGAVTAQRSALKEPALARASAAIASCLSTLVLLEKHDVRTVIRSLCPTCRRSFDIVRLALEASEKGLAS